jgi:RNA polymerase sigma factor (sigma-70 family)
VAPVDLDARPREAVGLAAGGYICGRERDNRLMTSVRQRPDQRSDVLLLVDADDDPAAFAVLYERHVGAVYDWLARRMGWLAADLTAETFARAWLRRDRFRDDRGGSALPWLLGIAGRLVADAARHDRVETRARERLGLSVDLADDGYDLVERRLSPRPMLERALAQLPAHERDAVDLRVIEELGYDEIAQQLSIKPAAARLRVSRALRRLSRSVPKEEW